MHQVLCLQECVPALIDATQRKRIASILVATLVTLAIVTADLAMGGRPDPPARGEPGDEDTAGERARGVRAERHRPDAPDDLVAARGRGDERTGQPEEEEPALERSAQRAPAACWRAARSVASS